MPDSESLVPRKEEIPELAIQDLGGGEFFKRLCFFPPQLTVVRHYLFIFLVKYQIYRALLTVSYKIRLGVVVF